MSTNFNQHRIPTAASYLVSFIRQAHIDEKLLKELKPTFWHFKNVHDQKTLLRSTTVIMVMKKQNVMKWLRENNRSINLLNNQCQLLNPGNNSYHTELPLLYSHRYTILYKYWDISNNRNDSILMNSSHIDGETDDSRSFFQSLVIKPA